MVTQRLHDSIMSIYFHVSREKPRMESNLYDRRQVRCGMRKRNTSAFRLCGGTTNISRSDARRFLSTCREDRTRYVHDEKCPAFQEKCEAILSRSVALVCCHEGSSPFAVFPATRDNTLIARQSHDASRLLDTPVQRLCNDRITIV